MKIKTDEINRKIQIDINPQDYFLTKVAEDLEHCGEYALSHRINMDYCGKPDQCGSEVIFLSREEYEKLKGLVAEIL